MKRAIIASILLLLGILGCSGGDNLDGEPGVQPEQQRSASQVQSSIGVEFPEQPASVVHAESGTEVVYSTRLTGDANADLNVGPLDLNAVVDEFGSEAGESGEGPLSSDHNGDGSVGPLDFNAVIERFGNAHSGFAVHVSESGDPAQTEGETFRTDSEDLDWEVSPDDAIDWTLTLPPDATGNLMLVPLDGDGNPRTGSASPVWDLPEPPEELTVVLNVNQDSGPAPLEVEFTAQVSGAGGAELQFDWYFDGEGEVDEEAGSSSQTYEYDTPGTYQARVEVSTDSGESASDETEIVVAENLPPEAQLTASPENGEVPLPVEFDASGSSDPEGAVERYEWDFDNDNLVDDTTLAPQTTHEFKDPGTFLSKVTVVDEVGNTDSAQVTILATSPPPNQPPEADLTADPMSGPAPLPVQLDASGSSDPEGAIESYDWDFDGDGNFENPDGGPQEEYTYESPGEYTPTVRVTDSEGENDTAEVTVDVKVPQVDDWDLQTPDTSGDDVGRYTAVTNLDGQPVISYRDVTNADLKVARKTETGWEPETVDSGGDVGRFTSIAVVSGQPAVSYYDADSENLKYARWDGAEWSIETVDEVTDTGKYSSLAVVGGKPSICYQLESALDNDLRFAQKVAGEWQTETVDQDADFGGWCSVAEVGSQPAISYYSASTGDLKYAEFDGQEWQDETVESDGNTGKYSSLVEWNGAPAISFYDQDEGTLKFTRREAGSWQTETVDAESANTGWHTSLEVIGDNPAISYYDSANKDLKYARYDGTEWGTEVVDSAGAVGRWSSLAVFGGLPGISYRDADNGTLKFAEGLSE